jgi:phosphoglycerate dehydrogenase-like enzyme
LDWLPPNVALTNNRGVHAEKAQEFIAMSLLMLNAQAPEMILAQRQRQWRRRFTSSIRGKTLLIIGVGNMGGAAAAAGRMLGLRVIGVRRSARSSPLVHEMHPPSALDVLLPGADFVVVAAPLTRETSQMLDAGRLNRIKPGAGLINIGRANVLDYAHLARMLQEERLSGAILDVFNPEPLPSDSPLWDTPRLVVTPHCSSDDLDSYAPRTADLVLRNAAHKLAGEELENLVRRDLGY